MVIYDKFFTKNNCITFNILLLRILTIMFVFAFDEFIFNC